MLTIGITGGIASGKTTASNYLKLKKSSYVFNADEVAKNILKTNKEIQKELINNFGKAILKNKKIDSWRLANIAFQNKKNQKLLNDVFWPEINKCLFQDINKKKSFLKIFIVDAALIIESGLYTKLDFILLIKSNKKNRLSRIINKNQLALKN